MKGRKSLNIRNLLPFSASSDKNHTLVSCGRFIKRKRPGGHRGCPRRRKGRREGKKENTAFYRGCGVCSGRVTGRQLECVSSGQLEMMRLLVALHPQGLARKVPDW